MATDLHDRDCLGVLDGNLQSVVIQPAWNNGQSVVARDKWHGVGGGAGREACDARNNLNRVVRLQPCKHIHKGPVEKRVALTQHNHVPARVQVRRDVFGRIVIDGLGGCPSRAHGHPHDDLGRVGAYGLGDD